MLSNLMGNVKTAWSRFGWLKMHTLILKLVLSKFSQPCNKLKAKYSIVISKWVIKNSGTSFPFFNQAQRWRWPMAMQSAAAESLLFGQSSWFFFFFFQMIILFSFTVWVYPKVWLLPTKIAQIHVLQIQEG